MISHPSVQRKWKPDCEFQVHDTQIKVQTNAVMTINLFLGTNTSFTAQLAE